VESIHEGAALRISLLLADIHIDAGELFKAAEIISHMEPAVGLAPPAARDTSDSASTTAAAAAGSPSHGDDSEDSPAGAKDAVSHTAASELPAGAGSAVSLDAESSSSTSSSSTSAGNTATGSASMLELPLISKLASPMLEKVFVLAEQQVGRVTRPDSLLLVRLHKLRLLLACANQHAAKRELKALTAAAPGCSALLLHRARLELQRHNHRRCLKLLGSLLQVGDLLGCCAPGPRQCGSAA
jgi:hypothetical protein